MGNKGIRELLRKLKEASTDQELKALGADFAASYENWLIYKHPALGDKRIFFKKENAEGELKLTYDIIQ